MVRRAFRPQPTGDAAKCSENGMSQPNERPRNRMVVLLTSIKIVLAIAGVDFWMEPYFSLRFL